jgi:hypothetical protein
MPAGDATGPFGMGPRTGRSMGYCSGYDMPGWANWRPTRRFFGRGWAPRGFGRGRGGRGWRHWYYATGLPRWARWSASSAWSYGPVAEPPSREEEMSALKDEAAWLKEQLDAINRRMDEMGQE